MCLLFVLLPLLLWRYFLQLDEVERLVLGFVGSRGFVEAFLCSRRQFVEFGLLLNSDCALERFVP